MKKPRGRRPGKPDVRAPILQAAHDLFLANGYAGTTLRAVAAAVDVDVALISYYFGSKQGLFGAAMTWTTSPVEILRSTLAGDPATLTERLVHAMTVAWDDPATSASSVALLSAALDDPERMPLVREFLEREVIDPMTAAMGGGPDVRTRAAAAVSILFGLTMARHILGLPTITALSVPEIQRLYTPALKALR